MKYLVFIIAIFVCPITIATERVVEIKYEKNQKVDLGALTVDGELVTPGDLTIADENSGETNSYYERKNYQDYIELDKNSGF